MPSFIQGQQVPRRRCWVNVVLPMLCSGEDAAVAVTIQGDGRVFALCDPCFDRWSNSATTFVLSEVRL